MRAAVSSRLPARFSRPPTFRVRATMATAAPSAARRSAMPAPMPRLAPVTMTLRPANRPLMLPPSFVRGGSRCGSRVGVAALLQEASGGHAEVLDVVVVETVVQGQDQSLLHHPVGIRESALRHAVRHLRERGLAG